MKQSISYNRTARGLLLAGAAVSALSMSSGVAFAQETIEEIVVTGSRIVRSDYVANSPLTSVSGDQLTGNADVTVESFLNTLPQVNPASTSTSNNPGNNGQANIDLRGFGSNRNIVLVDGRRAMVSANTLAVDVNTIPAALIERVEVITGGAGAAYGADAISGAVNFILKDDFEGADIRASWQDATEHWDSREYTVSGVIGGNFADGKGNAVLSFEHSEREALIKSQRAFAKMATSTTGSPPEGNLRLSSTNPFTLASVQQVFGGYGVAANKVSLSGGFGFNKDGSLFYNGVFNSPLDVQNFRDPIGDGVNTTYYPDFYSYNFDAVNILTLPLKRDSFMGKAHYKSDSGIEAFGSLGWTEYTSSSALAPTPTGSGTARAASSITSPTQVISALVTPGRSWSGGLLIPVTNPFIPNDLRTILNSRTGDDPTLVGSGANEPFAMGSRFVPGGLRKENYENTVAQATLGLRGPIFDTGWDWEFSGSEGRTEIDNRQEGNVNNQRLFDLLAAADGGASLCAGGLNIFGQQPVSQDCINYLQVNTNTTTELRQRIVQGFVRGDLFELPAGAVSVVVGAEYRGFRYDYQPGAISGAVVGFNNGTQDKGKNQFRDIFTEALIPLVKDQPFMKSLELNVGYRYSESKFKDEINHISADLGGADAYKAELSWAVDDITRLRGSYQRSVRAPNFGELFAGGSSFPQIFDPCSSTSVARAGSSAAALRQLCINTGVASGSIDSFVAIPGSQAEIVFAGNRDLKPEQGDTFTIGAVLSSFSDEPWLRGLTGSLDYWNVKISDPILGASTNDLIAACYNYHGANPTYDANYFACDGLVRSGGNISFIDDLNSADGSFLLRNGGKQQASGLDLQVNYALDAEEVGLGNIGTFNLNTVLSYLIEWNQRVDSWAPTLDYAGTIAYFGAGLGQSFPEWKATTNLTWNYEDLTSNIRARYIGSMTNRASVEFPGEKFTGVDAVWYFDVSASYNVTEALTLTVGVNNAFDKKPELYAPNIQSGTDPSTYDVIGRRLFASARVRF